MPAFLFVRTESKLFFRNMVLAKEFCILARLFLVFMQLIVVTRFSLLCLEPMEPEII